MEAISRKTEFGYDLGGVLFPIEGILKPVGYLKHGTTAEIKPNAFFKNASNTMEQM